METTLIIYAHHENSHGRKKEKKKTQTLPLSSQILCILTLIETSHKRLMMCHRHYGKLKKKP